MLCRENAGDLLRAREEGRRNANGFDMLGLHSRASSNSAEKRTLHPNKQSFKRIAGARELRKRDSAAAAYSSNGIFKNKIIEKKMRWDAKYIHSKLAFYADTLI